MLRKPLLNEQVETGRGMPGRKVIIYVRWSGNHKLLVPLEQSQDGSERLGGEAGGITVMMIGNAQEMLRYHIVF